MLTTALSLGADISKENATVKKAYVEVTPIQLATGCNGGFCNYQGLTTTNKTNKKLLLKIFKKETFLSPNHTFSFYRIASFSLTSTHPWCL